MLIDCNNDGTIQSPDEEFGQYHEDILIVPVRHDGIDFFAQGGAELKIGDKDAILSSARPCPDWCNSSGKNISVTERYFHKVTPIFSRVISDPLPTNPYSGLCD